MAPLELNPYERLPREQQQSGGLPWHLFSFALFLLIVACGAYLGLAFGYAPILSNRIEQLDAELVTLGEQIPEDQRNGFIQLYSQIANLQSMLKRHVMASALFPVIEKNTHVNVFYSNFDLSVPENRIALEGSASSYEVLAQQLEAWTKVKEIEKSYIAESQLSEGRVRFRLVLQFIPAFFTPRVVGSVAGATVDTEESSAVVKPTPARPIRVGPIAVPVR